MTATGALRGVNRGALVALLVAAMLASAPSARSAQSPVQPGSPSQGPVRDTPPIVQTPGTAVIRGRVVGGNGSDPLPRARVSADSNDVPIQFTDGSGRFELRGLRAGRYSLEVSKAGYVNTRPVQGAGSISNRARRTFQVADGQTVDADFVLDKGGVISGRVIDEHANDVTGARVYVYRWRWDTWQRFLTHDDTMTDQTDDLGQFRLFGLPPGEYVLVVDAVSPFGAGGLTAYYPAASSPGNAESITLRAGQEVSGAFVTFVRTRSAAITGVVRAADGLVLAAETVRADPVVSRAGGGGWALNARIRPDGTYVFGSMPPGEYTLTVLNASQTERQFAATRVMLEGTDLVVPLTVRPGNALRGRYVFEGGAPAGDVQRPMIPNGRAFVRLDQYLSDAAGSWTTNANWTFEAKGLSGPHRLRAPAPAGWGVKSVRLGPQDVTDAPFEFNGQDIEGVEILLTQRITRVAVSVAGARADTPEVRVVVFAEDETKLGPGTRFWTFRRPDAAGLVTVTGLPPARYLAVAVENLEPGDETNPEILRRLRSVATGLALDEGESVALNLTVQPIPPAR